MRRVGTVFTVTSMACSASTARRTGSREPSGRSLTPSHVATASSSRYRSITCMGYFPCFLWYTNQ